MSFNDEEIVVTIDAKRFIAIGLLAILTIATLSSYIIALLAWVAPDADYLAAVNSIETYKGAVPTSTFSPGNTVIVKAEIELATWYLAPYSAVSDTDARVFIVVYYDPGTGVRPLHYYTTTTTLTPGVPFNVQTQFALSSSAAAGTDDYYVHCVVWDTYLPTGDTLVEVMDFIPDQEVTFSVS